MITSIPGSNYVEYFIMCLIVINALAPCEKGLTSISNNFWFTINCH